MKIHLGCGRYIRPNWTNIDVMDIDTTYYYKWDLSNGLPNWISGVDNVYSSHFLEHLEYDKVINLITDCYNRMSRGGKFRASLPCFKKACIAYINNDYDYFRDLYWVSPSTLIGQMSYLVYQTGEHRSIWDSEELIRVLNSVGFINVKEALYDEDQDPNDPLRQKYSFYVEAFKP